MAILHCCDAVSWEFSNVKVLCAWLPPRHLPPFHHKYSCISINKFTSSSSHGLVRASSNWSVCSLVSLLFCGSFYILVWISLPMIFNFRLTIDFNWRWETRDGNNLWLRGLGDYPELLDVTLRPESVSEKRTQGWCLWGPEYCLKKCPTWCLNWHVSRKQSPVPGHTMADKQSLWHVCLLHLGTGVQGPSCV